MRDDGLDIPIPDRFEPSTHYIRELVRLGLGLDKLDHMTLAEAEVQSNLIFLKAQEDRENSVIKNQTEIEAYEKMLAKVHSWTPPTEEHEKLKNFMVEQLVSSINSDDLSEYYENHPIEKLSGADWLVQEMQSTIKDIKYHEKANKKEIERIEEKNKWIKELRESL